MKTLRALTFGLALVLTGTAVAFAHHSFAAEFDGQKPITIKGTLTKVEWTNPHIWYFVDVKNPDGTVTKWGFSAGAPGQLMRRGIRREQLVIGAVVNVEGFQAKDGSHNGFGSKVTYEDGRGIFTSLAADTQGAATPAR